MTATRSTTGDDARNSQFPGRSMPMVVLMNAIAQASAAPVSGPKLDNRRVTGGDRRPAHRGRRRRGHPGRGRLALGRPPGCARRRDHRMGALLLLRARVRRGPDARQEADEDPRGARRRAARRHGRDRGADHSARDRQLPGRHDRDARHGRAPPADRRPRGRDDRGRRVGTRRDGAPGAGCRRLPACRPGGRGRDEPEAEEPEAQAEPEPEPSRTSRSRPRRSRCPRARSRRRRWPT